MNFGQELIIIFVSIFFGIKFRRLKKERKHVDFRPFSFKIHFLCVKSFCGQFYFLVIARSVTKLCRLCIGGACVRS